MARLSTIGKLRAVCRPGWQGVACWGGVAGLFLLGAAMGAGTGDQPAPRVIKAKCFVLKDEQGRPRAALHFSPERDKGTATCPTLTFLGPDGKMRIRLTYQDPLQVAQLAMADDKGALRVVSLATEQASGLYLCRDGIANSLIGVGVGKRTGWINMFDGKKVPQANFLVFEDDRAFFEICDAERNNVGP